MGKIWFTSDTHFGAERTLELSKRPFCSVEEMDEIIINNWNSVVKENDTVYHLGDFGDYSIVSRLNGRINLIFGNYERNDNIDIQQLKKYGFNEVYKDSQIRRLNDLLLVNMSHEPSKAIKSNNEDMFNLFGHIHKLQMVRRYGLNVGMDCHNFYPIDVDEVMFYKTAIDKFYDEEVFK
ncbi:metallophosphoesterase [Paraclostridium bifermentans]